MAGLLTGYAAYKGHGLKNYAAGGAALGLLSSFGFGHALYDQSVGQLEGHTSFRDRILAERSIKTKHIR